MIPIVPIVWLMSFWRVKCEVYYNVLFGGIVSRSFDWIELLQSYKILQLREG